MNERKPYSTDLTDAQWRVLEPLVPTPKQGGRRPKYARREIVNAKYVRREIVNAKSLSH